MAERKTTAAPNYEALPEGTPVLAFPGSREGRAILTTTRSEAWTLPSGERVVMVEGYPGGIALTHIEVMPVTAPTPDALTAEVSGVEYAIENGWLVEVVNEHTCGTGPDGYYGAHEPGCGMVPIAKIGDLLAAREAAAANRGRAEGAERIAQAIEAEARDGLAHLSNENEAKRQIQWTLRRAATLARADGER